MDTTSKANSKTTGSDDCAKTKNELDSYIEKINKAFLDDLTDILKLKSVLDIDDSRTSRIDNAIKKENIKSRLDEIEERLEKLEK